MWTIALFYSEYSLVYFRLNRWRIYDLGRICRTSFCCGSHCFLHCRNWRSRMNRHIPLIWSFMKKKNQNRGASASISFIIINSQYMACLMWHSIILCIMYSAFLMNFGNSLLRITGHSHRIIPDPQFDLWINQMQYFDDVREARTATLNFALFAKRPLTHADNSLSRLLSLTIGYNDTFLYVNPRQSIVCCPLLTI